VTRPRAETSSYPEAIDLAKRAVSLAPNRFEFLSTLGSCQYRLGSWRDAIESLTRSLDLAKGEQESFMTFYLAMVCYMAGDENAARQWLERAVRWMDSNAPYDERLLRLRNEAENVVAGTDG
jgi:Flp pilus assembly protein TadD